MKFVFGLFSCLVLAAGLSACGGGGGGTASTGSNPNATAAHGVSSTGSVSVVTAN